MILFCALLIGVVAGLRTMTALAAVSWAAYLGHLDLSGTWFRILGLPFTPYLLTVLAALELITDQLSTTPSRKVPIQFIGRILTGALCGGAVGTRANALALGMLIGAGGAVLGTLGGAAARQRMAEAFRKDTPAALIEDAVAIGAAALIVSVFA